MDLSNVKLKKTTTKIKDTTPQVLLCNNSQEYQELMEDTYMENYFDTIKSFSFGSTFLPLSKETATALVKAREQYLTGDTESKNLVSEMPLLSALAKSIEDSREKSGWKYIFVRLSSRSPKDAALSSPKFEKIFEKEYRSLKTETTYATIKSDVNLRLHALYRASTWALSTESGVEAVQLFIESDRTADDLKEYSEGKMNVKDFNIVIRDFRIFPVEFEFRGFIYQKKLTALTQYNEFCYFHKIGPFSDLILKLIKKDFSEMIEAIPNSNYVVDFVIAPKEPTQNLDDETECKLKRFCDVLLDEYKVFIIEINPLAEFAGTGLFTWENDKSLLLGKKPFEFRYHKDLVDPNWVFSNMTPSWKKYAIGPPEKKTPSITTSRQSALINLNVNTLWKIVRNCTFEWQRNIVKKTDIDGETRLIHYLDRTQQRIKVTEISDRDKRISWLMVESDPPVWYSSRDDTIRLTAITTPNEVEHQTLIEWISEFSSDATLEVIMDSNLKKSDAFRDLIGDVAHRASLSYDPDEFSKVDQWLQNMRAGKYKDQFIELGYTRMSTILSWEEEEMEEKLKPVGMRPQAQSRMLNQLVAIKNYLKANA